MPVFNLTDWEFRDSKGGAIGTSSGPVLALAAKSGFFCEEKGALKPQCKSCGGAADGESAQMRDDIFVR